MARRKVGDGEIVDIGENGEMLLPPPEAARAPDTQATRKTEAAFWQLLGNDKEGTGYITVHFLGNGKNGSETIILKCDADKYSSIDELMSVVQRDHAWKIHPNAEGDYRVRLYVHNGTQHVKRGEELKTLLAGAPPSQGMAVQGDSTAAMLQLFREMQARDDARQQRLLEALESLKTQPVKPPSIADALAPWMPILGPIATAAGTALVARISNPPKSDTLAVMERAFTIAGIAKDFQAGQPAPDVEPAPWYAPAVEQIAQALPHFAQALAGKATLPAPAGAPIHPGAAPGIPQGGNPQHPFYPQLDSIVRIADQADPEEVAHQVWQMLPEPMRPQAVPFLTAPGAYRRLVEVHPGVLDHPVFFGDLIDVLTELAQGPEVASAPGVVIDSPGVTVHPAGQETGTGFASHDDQSGGNGTAG